ncbi:MAG: hypothetical protein ACLQQ0_01735 [Limisphaerales bacterium]
MENTFTTELATVSVLASVGVLVTAVVLAAAASAAPMWIGMKSTARLAANKSSLSGLRPGGRMFI